MEELEKETPIDELMIEIIEQEAAKYEVTVDYYIWEFM
jgi:hypothetical protein